MKINAGLLAILVGCRGAVAIPQDAGVDGDVVAPDGGCWTEAPNALCEHLSAAETRSETPQGPAVLRIETVEARAVLCAGPWTVTRCEYAETYSDSMGATTTADAGCSSSQHVGGYVRVLCSERTVYRVGGDLQWEHSRSWDRVQLTR
jgi:hypothetical protein